MPNNHILTKTYNVLKGFSTDNIYSRPPQVSDVMLNMMKEQDNSFSPRRGYQAQIADIGGLGNAVFEKKAEGTQESICIDPDGKMYRRLPGYLYLSYSGNGYVTYSIFTDDSTGFDITFQILVKVAASVDGIQNNINTVTVDNPPLNTINVGNIISFTNRNTGVLEKRTVTGVSATTITFGGLPASFLDNDPIDLFGEIKFGNGYDVVTPFTIANFLTAFTALNITNADLVYAGLTSVPAAFITCVEPTILLSGADPATLNYFFWEAIPAPVNKLFPLFTDPKVLNGEDFENAAFASFDEVLYATTGYDPLVKYDGQTAYYAGMPQAQEVVTLNDGVAFDSNYLDPGTYTYAITYEQVDNAGHIVEGNISLQKSITIASAQAIDVTVPNLSGNSGYNTSINLAVPGTADVYGPDIDGFYYDRLGANSVSLIEADNGYYYDNSLATCNLTATSNTHQVNTGHDVEIGDTLIVQVGSTSQVVKRNVVNTTPTTVTLDGSPVLVNSGSQFKGYKSHKIYPKIAIVNANVVNSNNIVIKVAPLTFADFGFVVGNVIQFTDSDGNFQERTITAVNAGLNQITINQSPVSISALTLITGLPGLTTHFWIQKEVTQATIITTPEVFVSNNLRVNIYRSKANGTELFLVASIPASPGGNYIYRDIFKDSELGRQYQFLDRPPSLPPLARYISSYQNQLILGGTVLGSGQDDDAIYFSEGNQPESYPAATNFFLVPSNNDRVSGIGVSGSTLIIGKKRSLYAVTGSLLTSQFEVIGIQPGSNIGVEAHATIVSANGIMFFMSSNGVYTISESQMFPVDQWGMPVPISRPISSIFRSQNAIKNQQYKFKRAVAVNYAKDLQYLLFLPCEDVQTPTRTANENSRILAWDYQNKNWYEWSQMNAAGGFMILGEDLLWQERRYSPFVGTSTANTYQQRRNYRLTDYADHTNPIPIEWKSSWEDAGQPEVRKKFERCMLLFDRIESIYQDNRLDMEFTSWSDRIPTVAVTKKTITTVFNNPVQSSYSLVPWGWGVYSGYFDTFARIEMKSGSVAKSVQIGFKMKKLNTSFRFSGFQLEIIPAFRRTIVR